MGEGCESRVLMVGVRVPREGPANSCCSRPLPGEPCRSEGVCGRVSSVRASVCGLPGAARGGRHPCSKTRISLRVRSRRVRMARRVGATPGLGVRSVHTLPVCEI